MLLLTGGSWRPMESWNGGERQQVQWTWRMVRDTLEHDLREHPAVRRLAPEIERAVQAGELTPALAAKQILDAFRDQRQLN